MHHDFELYSHEQEQQLQYIPAPQPFLPSSTYNMEQSFSAPFQHMLPLVEAPRPQYHYDPMAQGPELAQYGYHSASNSPHSTLNSFQDQPPILSASSESGASASSSALGSPSITPQFEVESWNPMAMGLTSSFEYPAIVAAEKSYVGESLSSSVTTTSSFVPSSPFISSNTFKTPIAPASARWPSSRSSLRRNSLLSNEIDPFDLPVSSAPVISSSLISRASSISPVSQDSCWLPPSSVNLPTPRRELTSRLQIQT